MQYFPLFMDLNQKPVLVVGGGEVATRKVESLLRAGAMVTIVAPELTDTLQQYVAGGKCRWLCEPYRSELMTEYVQVWATTDSNSLNHQVHADAKRRGILVNVVDDKPYCDFITPSMINRGRIQVAISSGGASPVLVRNIREQLEVTLPQSLALLAEFGEKKREAIKQHFITVDERRMFWERLLSRVDEQHIESIDDIEQLYQQEVSREHSVTMSLNWLEYGSDVELLSIKALRLMQKAELVLHPLDCPFQFIDLCRRDAERQSYTSPEGLQIKLDNAQQHKVNSVCIFIRKGSYEENPALKQLIESASLLRIVG